MHLKLIITFYIIALATTHISTEDNIAGNTHSERKLSRKPRAFASPFTAFFGPLFETIRIKSEQKNDTEFTLRMAYDVLADSFSDTYIPTIEETPLPTEDAMNDNVTTSTTTERYRISRHELGRILGANYLGLQRLFAIELEDAKNQSQYSIAELKEYNQSQNQKVLKF